MARVTVTEDATIKRSASPVTEASMLAELRQAGVEDGAVVLTHCSLSALGWVCGGAAAVIRALLTAVGERGTLVFPAQSADLSDPRYWEAPPVPEGWWQTIRDSMPAFDTRLTTTRGMGAVAELFRTLPGVVRSHHPTCSFAALGPQAASIVERQALQDPFGEGSPLSRLYELDASLLLLGVGYDSCTMLHLAERRALGERQARVAQGAPMQVSGKRQRVTFELPDIDSNDFEAVGARYEASLARPVTFQLGHGLARRLNARQLVDFGVPWLSATRDGNPSDPVSKR